MKQTLTPFTVSAYTAEREWTADGIPVLSASVSLPRPEGRQTPAERRIHHFYQLQARSFFRYCEGLLFPQAAAEFRAALSASAPLPHWTAELSYRETYRSAGLWSLYTQSREVTLPGRTLLTRHGDTWDLATGYPRSLASFFPAHTDWKRQLKGRAAAEISRQEASGDARYLDGWRKKLRRSFPGQHFYLTDAGLVYFYPMYALAPAAEGIPTFLLPYGEGGLADLPALETPFTPLPLADVPQLTRKSTGE